MAWASRRRRAAVLVEHDRLDLGHRDFAIEAGVASQVDLLAGALTEQAGMR